MIRRGQRVLMLSASLLLALLLAEAGLWLLDIPRHIASFRFLGDVFGEAGTFQEDPDLFWRLDGDTGRYRVNDLGLRGPRVPVEKGPRDLRIACFGDSCTFGSGVRLEDTYGWLLQERLQERLGDHRVQVILAALPGYSSYQSLVLFEKHIAPRRPDITVLYIGGWNDYVPAMGETDRQRGTRLQAESNSLWRRWRLVRLCSRILAPNPGLTREEYAAAFERGEAPDGRRVPVQDFRQNLGALVRGAREIGSDVLLLVPPLPEDTLQKHPAALVYRDAVRSAAESSGARLVDPTDAFAARAGDTTSADLPGHYRGCWPCFLDGVHPSILGHRLLADRLQQALRDQDLGRAPATGPAALDLENLEPRSVVGGQRSHIVLTGSGDPRTVDAASRAMVGRWWVPGWQLLPGPGTIRFDLPPAIPPGAWPARLVTGAGVASCREPLVVKPARLLVELSRQGRIVTLRFKISGPANWAVGVWVGTGRRKQPAPTRFGLFHLAADPDGRLPGSKDDTPFMFLRLALPQAVGTIPAGGTWRHETGIDVDRLETVPERIHVQGLMRRDEAHGILTEVVTLAVPR